MLGSSLGYINIWGVIVTFHSQEVFHQGHSSAYIVIDLLCSSQGIICNYYFKIFFTQVTTTLPFYTQSATW